MENYPRNSRSSREQPEKAKLERVTQGEVLRRKKPLSKRFAETFLGGNLSNAGSYVMFDVLLPAFRDMVADAFSMGAEKMIYGDARSTSRRTGIRPGGPSGHTPYRTVSSSGLRPDPRDTGMSRRGRATHDMSEIVLQTRHEAADVLDRMFELCQKYDQVTLSELYDLVGETAAYTDDKYGWTDLRDADIRRVREGYLLDLPRPEPLG